MDFQQHRLLHRVFSSTCNLFYVCTYSASFIVTLDCKESLVVNSEINNMAQLSRKKGLHLGIYGSLLVSFIRILRKVRTTLRKIVENGARVSQSQRRDNIS